MYKEFFGIRTSPFSIAPDPHFLYMSDGHREALAHLRYGLGEGGGFVLLTGEVGTGKTTVCRCILEQIPEDTNVAFVLNPKLSVLELLATICDELHVDYPRDGGLKILIDRLNAYLLAAHGRGQRTVLIIDEAQNLSHEVLEQIRLLTNLETNQQRLLQIILLGQPELQEKLSQPELRQLSQRIAARHHLGPLSRAETTAYIHHRLAVAGMEQSVFAPAAVKEVFGLSCGIPRMINLICDRALLGAFGKGVGRVDRSLVLGAARQVFGHNVKNRGAADGKWVRRVHRSLAGDASCQLFGLTISSRLAQGVTWMILGVMTAVALFYGVVLTWPELGRWGVR